MRPCLPPVGGLLPMIGVKFSRSPAPSRRNGAGGTGPVAVPRQRADQRLKSRKPFAVLARRSRRDPNEQWADERAQPAQRRIETIARPPAAGRSRGDAHARVGASRSALSARVPRGMVSAPGAQCPSRQAASVWPAPAGFGDDVREHGIASRRRQWLRPRALGRRIRQGRADRATRRAGCPRRSAQAGSMRAKVAPASW